MPTNLRAYGAEALGTALLVIGGCGAAIFAGQQIGVLGVALAFGLTLTLIAYLLGPVSGAHVNPAVTLALALSGKFSWKDTPWYMVSQVVGGIIGGAVLYGISAAIVIEGKSVLPQIIESGFASNRLPDSFDTILPGVILEVVMTAIFVLAVLATSRKGFPQASVPVTVGSALALVHLISIPITNTSVNPARSIGVGIFNPEAWADLRVFVVAPLVGAAIAFLLYRFIVEEAKVEEKGTDAPKAELPTTPASPSAKVAA